MMKRSPIFDYARHILAITVIVSHAWPVLRGDNTTEPLMLLTGGALTFGTLAVLGFFLLSGHLITQSWRRDPRILPFTRRRIARLAPAWIVALAFNALLCALFADFVANPLSGPINAPLWTLFWEVACYLLVIVTRGRSWLIAVLGIVLLALGYHGTVPWLLLAFGVGSFIPRAPRIALPPLRFDYSYGLYVYAFPIQQALVWLFGRHLPPLVLAALAILAVLPLCALSWRFVEQPTLRLGHPKPITAQLVIGADVGGIPVDTEANPIGLRRTADTGQRAP
jgi:peptidoglycan/LPS O-acetylase OafA/YrhL